MTIKQKLNIGSTLMLLFLTLFIVQNIVFTILYGWHIKAQSSVENIVDIITQFIYIVGLVYLISALYKSIIIIALLEEKYIEERKTSIKNCKNES